MGEKILHGDRRAAGGQDRGHAIVQLRQRIASRREQHGAPGLAPGQGAGAERRNEARPHQRRLAAARSEEHTSELQSLMRISYAVFCLKKKIIILPIALLSLPNQESLY